MYKGKTILAIVTARGGSKGLPGKNIKEMNGKPLIAHTLDSIGKSQYLDDFYISTDSEKIAETCENYGYCVPELRPSELALDTTPSVDVLLYSIEKLEALGKKYDYFILLEPTSPLRRIDDIDNMIKLAVDHPNANGVISVGQVHLENPAILKVMDEHGYIRPFLSNRQEIYQRQQEEPVFFPYGVGYLIRTDVFKKEKGIYVDNMLPYLIERWQNYEIDDFYDFICVETVQREQMKG